MCGIFGYIGKQNAVKIVLNGLKQLEYRGYDSAGIATFKHNALIISKSVGKVSNLEEKISLEDMSGGLAIAHTRWATHGIPSEINAHPQVDSNMECAIVHNGIIENYQSLKDFLLLHGIKCVSDTDSEVIVQLISFFYKGDILGAVKDTIGMLKGSYAIAIIHKKHSNQIICTAKDSPLVLGVGEGEFFIASDSMSLLSHTREVINLKSSEIAVLSVNGISIFNHLLCGINKEIRTIDSDLEQSSKGEFSHFMLKEMYEQPFVLNNLLKKYTYSCSASGEIKFIIDSPLSDINFADFKHIKIVACGSSYHAGLIASYFLEEYACIPVSVESSAEFRYRDGCLPEGTLAFVISQSGETADTLAALHLLKKKACLVVGLCNVRGSAIAREVDVCLLLYAGQEIGVASTKAFTNQLVLLMLLGIKAAAQRDKLSNVVVNDYLHAMYDLVEKSKNILENICDIRSIAKKYSAFEHCFFFGRRYMYPTALESALKLKEIAYVDANGYPAGEMKHGPIALISPSILSVAFCCDKVLQDKVISGLMEVKAREGLIIAITYESTQARVESIADDVIVIPDTLDCFAPILSNIVGQSLAYYIAFERGLDIDCPRNLAKSVTVE